MAEFILHRLCESLDWDAPTFETRAQAFAARRSDQHVSFRPTLDESYEWRQRERGRLISGTYTPVPWQSDDWYYDLHSLHHTHLSLDHIGLVVYTPDEEFGHQDRQLRITPGKYLERFAYESLLSINTTYFAAPGYSHTRQARTEHYISSYAVDHPNAKIAPTVDACAKHKTQCTIAAYVDQCKAFDGRFNIATTPDDIEKVYLKGPSSCMDSRHWEMLSRNTGGIHPSRVYGPPGDLAVAYIGELKTKVTARCVIWPAKKIYTRVYGDTTLTRMLQNDGYSHDSLNGAHIARIECDHGLVMPYIDAVDWAYRDGRSNNYLVLTLTSEYLDRASTRQYFDTKPQCGTTEEPDADDDDEYICSRCENSRDEDETYCQSCMNDMFECQGCHDDRWPDDHGWHEVDDEPYCDRCYRRLNTCAVCDEKHTSEGRICDDCRGDGAQWCDDCETVYSTDACENCHVTDTCDCDECTDIRSIRTVDQS